MSDGYRPYFMPAHRRRGWLKDASRSELFAGLLWAVDAEDEARTEAAEFRQAIANIDFWADTLREQGFYQH